MKKILLLGIVAFAMGMNTISATDLTELGKYLSYQSNKLGHSSEDYKKYLATVHKKNPETPLTSDLPQFHKLAFCYGLYKVRTTLKEYPLRTDNYQNIIALVTATRTNSFFLAFSDEKQRNAIIENISSIFTSVKQIPIHDSKLRYRINVSDAIFRIHHFDILLENSDLKSHDEERSHRWLTKLWNNLSDLENNKKIKNLVINDLKAQLVLQHQYSPEGVSDILKYAKNLLNETNITKGTEAKSDDSESCIDYPKSHTCLQREQKSALIKLLNEQMEEGKEKQETDEDAHPLSLDSENTPLQLMESEEENAEIISLSNESSTGDTQTFSKKRKRLILDSESSDESEEENEGEGKKHSKKKERIRHVSKNFKWTPEAVQSLDVLVDEGYRSRDIHDYFEKKYNLKLAPTSIVHKRSILKKKK